MLTITYVGTDHHNPGDTITDLGVRALMHRGFGLHHGVQVMLRDEVDVDQYVLPPSDVLVVSGTPWLWDRFDESEKVRNLLLFLEGDNSTVRIALGIGSCYLSGYGPGPEARAAVDKVFGSFDAVLCRDPLAWEIAHGSLGDRALLRPCPSVFAPHALGVVADPTEDLALVFVDPFHCFGSGYLDPEVQRRVALVQDDLLNAGAQALCMTDVDEQAYRARHGVPACASRHPQTILEFLGRFSRVVSGRVHGAVPARALGCTVDLLPLDSRALTATLVGCGTLEVGTDLSWGRDGAAAQDRSPIPTLEDATVDLLEILGKAPSSRIVPMAVGR